MKFEFKFRLIEDGGEEMLDVPAFPEIVVSINQNDHKSRIIGAIVDDAIRNAIQARIDYDDEIPGSDSNDDLEGFETFRLSPLESVKILLYLEYLKRGVTRTEFARTVKATPTTLARVFDLAHSSRLEVILEMFAELNLKISTDVAVSNR